MAIRNRAVPSLTGAVWVTSSYSDGGQQCVQVAVNVPGLTPVRDSKDPAGPALLFPRRAFTQFVNATAAGEFGNDA
jgi:hypothetical protein